MLAAKSTVNYIPDHWKSDLLVGQSQQHPIVGALTDFVRGLQLRSLQLPFSLDPLVLNSKDQRQLLAYLGFCSDSLEDAEVQRWISGGLALPTATESLNALKALSEIYFQEARIQRGRSLAPSRIAPSENFRLGAVDDWNDTLVVRIEETSEIRKREFLGNAKKMVPPGFRILLASRSRTKPAAPNSWQLRAAALTPRRIPCRTSHR